MNFKNDIFLRAALGEKTERAPVWLMRQAGRILPQYRAIREKLSGFKELVETPELACEVTIQPVDELDVDAAIIFSDILVVPEAMGLIYEMIESRGPVFPKTIETQEDVRQLLKAETAAENLHYVYDAVRLTKKELNNRIPLIGFAGAPFTIFAYMVEGKGSKTFSKAKKMLYREPELAHQLLAAITDTTIAYLIKKTQAGVDLVQIFDSWAGVLTPDDFLEFSLPYIQKITTALKPFVPVTVFAKDAFHSLNEIAETDCNVLGLGWTTAADKARAQLGETKVLQGNLDPSVLYGENELIKKLTRKMLNDFGQHHIANLGHGVYPDTPLDSVKCFVDTVKEYSYENFK
jgi:uroporphyrinogen decarboxylase